MISIYSRRPLGPGSLLSLRHLLSKEIKIIDLNFKFYLS